MSKKTDLVASLAEIGGSTRRKPEPVSPSVSQTSQQPSRAGSSPITVHFPKQVRNQLKIMAVERDTTMHYLIAEAFNDLFAKYGKPEIAPKE